MKTMSNGSNRNWRRRIYAAIAIGAAISATACSTAPRETNPPRPLPETLSEAGRAALLAGASAPQPSATNLAARRTFLSDFQAEFGARQQRRYAVDIADAHIAGVPVRLIKAKNAPTAGNLILINLHGGGFNADSGSLTENIPIAATTGIPVVAVLYRLAPEHPFPAAVEDGLAVYRELLKTHAPSQIGIYGTSAGAIIGPELIARIQREKLPQPATFGLFSGDADFSRKGDTQSILPIDMTPRYRAYADQTEITDPLASPALGSVDFFPPTLCLSSSRDFYLSSTANFCRQLEMAGVENKLVVFDGLPHAFWSYLEMPESDQAFWIMAQFLKNHLKP